MLKTKQIPKCFTKYIWALCSTALTNGEGNQINDVRDIFFTASFLCDIEKKLTSSWYQFPTSWEVVETLQA